MNEGNLEQEREKAEGQRRDATTAFRTLVDLVKADLSAQAAVEKLKQAGAVGKDWAEMAPQIGALAEDDPEIRDLLQTLFQFGELKIATLGKHLATADRAMIR